MGQGIRGHSAGQVCGRGHQVLEITPTAGGFHGTVERRVISMCFEQGSPQDGKGAQRILQCRLGIRDAMIAQPFRIPPGLAHDPVMGLDHGIDNGSAPVHSTDRKDGQPPVAGNIAQPVCEVALSLPA